MKDQLLYVGNGHLIHRFDECFAPLFILKMFTSLIFILFLYPLIRLIRIKFPEQHVPLHQPFHCYFHPLDKSKCTLNLDGFNFFGTQDLTSCVLNEEEETLIILHDYDRESNPGRHSLWMVNPKIRFIYLCVCMCYVWTDLWCPIYRELDMNSSVRYDTFIQSLFSLSLCYLCISYYYDSEYHDTCSQRTTFYNPFPLHYKCIQICMTLAPFPSPLHKTCSPFTHVRNIYVRIYVKYVLALSFIGTHTYTHSYIYILSWIFLLTINLKEGRSECEYQFSRKVFAAKNVEMEVNWFLWCMNND